jgi:hypothetical protein
MLHDEERCMTGSEDFRAIAERIAALSASQIQTSESVARVMRDALASKNNPDVNKEITSKAQTAGSPRPDTQGPGRLDSR